MNMASTSKLEIQSSATGPVIQGDNNLIFFRDNHVTQQSEQNKTDVIETTLHAAVGNWNVDLVKKFIVEHGVDVNVKNDSNQTPLEALLSTVTPDCENNIITSTALRSTIAVLLEHGASVNKQYNEERTFLLLCSAISSNKLDLLESLLKQGFDLNSRDRWNDRVLHDAAEVGNFEAVKMLITHGADKNIPGNLQEPPVFKLVKHIVIKNRTIDQEVIEMLDLLNCKDFAKVSNYNGDTMLNFAVRGLHAELIELLINTYGTDVDKQDYFGRSPLNELVLNLNERSNKEEVIKSVQTLIRCGASLTIRDLLENTPLELLKSRQEDYQTNSFQYLVPYLTPSTSHNHNHTNEMCSILMKRIKKNYYIIIIVAIVLIVVGVSLNYY